MISISTYNNFCYLESQNMDTIESNYIFLHQIGVGSYGQVYLAEHKKSRQNVAIKTFNYRDNNDPFCKIQIQREIDVLKSIDHPYIIQLFDHFQTENAYFAVLEYLEGGNLLEKINSNGPIAESTAKLIFFQLITSIQFLHRHNIVHRDIKVENILFDKYRNIRLADFGLSCSTHNKEDLRQQCGSMSYAAPEVIKGEIYSNSVDIWSAGIVLYTMITGNLPFEDSNLQKLYQKIVTTNPTYPPTMSAQLVDLLNKILTKDPNQRIKSNDLLKHSWLGQVVQPTISENNAIDKDILQAMESWGYDIPFLINNLTNKLQTDDVIVYKIALREMRSKQIYNLTIQPRRSSIALMHKRNGYKIFRQIQISPSKPKIIVPSDSVNRRKSLSFLENS